LTVFIAKFNCTVLPVFFSETEKKSAMDQALRDIVRDLVVSLFVMFTVHVKPQKDSLNVSYMSNQNV
jgi:hypothetical protein